jgi:hypothetical protein
MKDMHSGFSAAVLVAAAALNADNTPVAVDLQGYEGCEIFIAVGAGGITFDGTNKVEFKLRHGDTSTVGAHAAVEQDDVLGAVVASGGIVKALTAAHASASVYRVGYIGGKRYISMLADFSGTHGSPTPVSVIAVKGHGYSQPEADQA